MGFNGGYDRGGQNRSFDRGSQNRSFDHGGQRQNLNNTKNEFNNAQREKFEFPETYLKFGYNKESGEFNPTYLTTLAERIGKELSNDGTTGKSKIRSYYDQVESLVTRLSSGALTEEQTKKQLTMLAPRVADRFNKGTASEIFKKFIEKNVAYLNKTENFKVDLYSFKLHFEAVVCYTN